MLLSQNGRERVPQLEEDLRKHLPAVSLKDVEGCLEILLNPEHRKSHGTVLTPDYIIDYLIEQAASFAGREDGVFTVCDPACGYGGFLIRAAAFLHRHKGITCREALEKHVVGLDIDSGTLKTARALVELFLLEHRCSIKGFHPRLFCLDSLCDSTDRIKQMTGVQEGFDIIATNPPYVKLQNLDPAYRERLLSTYAGFARGSFSTAMLFLVAAHRLLSSTGALAFITQNNLYTSLAGREVRRYLKQHKCIRRIVDFGHNKVFPNASAYTCLVFLGATPKASLEFTRTYSELEPSTLSNLDFSTIAHRELHTSKWRLARRQHLLNLSRIESVGVPLGEACQIRVGFATLKDKVYFVEDAGDHAKAALPNGEEMLIEKSITRGATKIAEFDEEGELAQNKRRIIFPYERHGGGFHPVPEEILNRDYPQCYAYLTQWKEELASRDKGKTVLSPWYAWGRCQSMAAPGPKLLTKTFSDRPNFLLDRTDRLFCNGYAVFPREHGGQASLFGSYALDLVQAIINSCVMDYYARLTSFQIEGDYQCYQKNFIERFNLPELSEVSPHEILQAHGEVRDALIAGLYGLEMADILEVLSNGKRAQRGG